MRALVVEDDPVTQKLIELTLLNERIACGKAGCGEDAIELARAYDVDIIILDLGLPDMDGFEVIRRLRAARVRTPVLILSAKGQPVDKVKGLTVGADDFLTKPFDRAELVARVQAVVRRSKGHSAAVIRTGELTLDMDTRSVEACGRRVDLTAKEYAVLELLALRKGTTLTKSMFLDHLYGGRDEPELKIIDVFVCKIRRKISAATGGPNYIETVWGRGYALKDPEAAAEHQPMAA